MSIIIVVNLQPHQLLVRGTRGKPLNKRFYSTKCNTFNSSTEIVGEKVYSNADTCKALILADNKGKSGIYR